MSTPPLAADLAVATSPTSVDVMAPPRGLPCVDLCRLDKDARFQVLLHIAKLSTNFSAVTPVDTPPHFTVFHSSFAPSLTLHEYHDVIMERLGLGRPCVSIALVLMQRYWALSGCLPSQLTMHRLFAAAMLVAMKLHHEYAWGNATFAPACGLSTVELNRLELGLLTGLGWKTFVTAKDVQCVVGTFLWPQ